MISSYSFAQNAVPPLESGEMTLTTVQTITTSGTPQSYSQAQSIVVTGVHFQLDPSLIDSTFPPAGGQGDFSEVLPHVVLTDQTLPWQRAMTLTPAPVPAPVNQAPWLALLVFDEGDPAPTVQAMTLATLTPTANTTYWPAISLDGESSGDPVSVIDVPVATFNTIAPSYLDLGWLAHTRTTPDGTPYSVIVANRLPAAGRQSVVHLVSLEGYAPMLPPDSSRGSNLPSSFEAVRLVTLANWQFISVAAGQTFGAVAQQLDASVAGMQLAAPATTQSAAADTAVKTAFGLGYTALNHTLRDGTATVSWYRGPLLPTAVPTLTLPAATNPDALLRYDPTTGMFDLTYAAAWQLGVLLALHDSAFAAALFRLKQTLAQQEAAQQEAQRIDQTLSAVAGPVPAAGGHQRVGHVISQIVAPGAAAIHRSHKEPS